MSIHETLARGLDVSPLPPTQGLRITGVTIFLYRAAQPRPDKQFNAGDAYHRMNSNPFRFAQSFSLHKLLFELFLDQCALQGVNPLCFHIDVHAMSLKPLEITLITKKGGGGYPPPATPDGDLAALRSLFDSLRSFPTGWERRTMMRIED